jgi:hypothetical protein
MHRCFCKELHSSHSYATTYETIRIRRRPRLLAVHSAIALNDAVLTVLTGSPYKGQDHGQAVSHTRLRCNEAKLDTGGIKHLANLVKRKTDIAYGNRETTFDEALKLSMDAERFETWAYRLLKKKGVTPEVL